MARLTSLPLLLAGLALSPSPAMAVPPCDPEVPPEDGVVLPEAELCTWETEPDCIWCEFHTETCEQAVERVIATGYEDQDAINDANYWCGSALFACFACQMRGFVCDNDDIVNRAEEYHLRIWQAIWHLVYSGPY